MQTSVADGFPLQHTVRDTVVPVQRRYVAAEPQFSILMALRQTLLMLATSVVDSSHVAVMSSGSLLSALSASQFVDSVCGLCGARNALSKV